MVRGGGFGVGPATVDGGMDLIECSVFVHISRLTEALKRCLWRQGFVHPERLTHAREPNGDHRFSVVIPRDLCEYEPPTAAASGASLGHSTGTTDKPKATG